MTELDATIRNRVGALIEWGELPLPVPSQAANQVMALVQKPRCEMHELATVIERDANLTAHLLQLVRSPVYAGAVRVSSVAQVVTRLGFSTIMQLTLAITSKRVFVAPGFEAELRDEFRHAFTTALFAQRIARMRRSTVDTAFIAGLLHDIGQPVLIQVLVDQHRECGVPVDREAILGYAKTAHEEAGAALATRWAVAPVVGEAIARHHAPAGHELAHVVALADALAHGVDAGPHPAALNLYPDDVDALRRETESVVAMVEAAS